MNIKKELIDILTDWYWDNMTKANKIMRLLAENNLISCKKCKFNVSCFGDICDKCDNYDMFEYDEEK